MNNTLKLLNPAPHCGRLVTRHPSLVTRRAGRAAFAFATAALLLVAPNAWSQSAPYPSKVVRVINPVAPGGNQDIVARAYAEQLTRALGQPVVVESRPGASAVVGTRYVKSSPPDGYTLLAVSNTFARTPAMKADAGYDPLKDFAAISQTCDVPLVLVVTPSLPVKNVKELIDLAKRRPGELTSGSSGVGSTGHVATAIFSQRAGIRMQDVQYKGAAPAVVDLVGGHIMLRFDQVTTSLPQIRSNKLRALAVTTRTRSSVLPEVPTMQESGLANYHDSTFNGYVAPAGTPRDIVERLRAEIAKAAADNELHARFREQGIDLVASKTPEEFSDFLRKEVSEFSNLARKARLTIDKP
jgi:tripartite-type tricarboxylate transporter receptor subunit TctC